MKTPIFFNTREGPAIEGLLSIFSKGVLMNRRESLQLILLGAASSALGKAFDSDLLGMIESPRILPAMQAHEISSELLINSRRSYHSGYSGALSDQILANVLWATAKAPVLGKSRFIYVALPDAVYEYDPVKHALTQRAAGNQRSDSTTAFEVGVAGELPEDAGAASHYGQLAAMAFWGSSGSGSKPVCCPKGSVAGKGSTSWNAAATVHMGNCYGGMTVSEALSKTLAAQSSNQSLPAPMADGSLSFEQALGNLRHGTDFLPDELSQNDLSQILWASYGCTPHTVSGSKLGLAAASASARYYLTGKIYLVTAAGIDRYWNRLPSGQTTTGDHRSERVITGDRRAALRQSLARLPATASSYIVFCSATAGSSELIESGYCGAGALLQATSLGLQGHLTAAITSGERKSIGTALNIPTADLPLLIFSVGKTKSTGFRRRGPGAGAKKIGTYLYAEPARSGKAIIFRYGVDSPGRVMLVIHDAAGKRVATILDCARPAGEYAAAWDWTGGRSRRVTPGTYLCTLKVGTGSYSQRVAVR